MATKNVNSIEKIEGIPKVTDGDTIKIDNKKIRLYGIDAPEINQKCKKPFFLVSFLSFYKEYNCGLYSTEKLKNKIANKSIKCHLYDRDKYGRFVGECYYKNTNLNGWMVKNGYALAYLKYSKKFLILENFAQSNKKGIWQGDFEKPWDWRKRIK